MDRNKTNEDEEFKTTYQNSYNNTNYWKYWKQNKDFYSHKSINHFTSLYENKDKYEKIQKNSWKSDKEIFKETILGGIEGIAKSSPNNPEKLSKKEVIKSFGKGVSVGFFQGLIKDTTKNNDNAALNKKI